MNWWVMGLFPVFILTRLLWFVVNIWKHAKRIVNNTEGWQLFRNVRAFWNVANINRAFICSLGFLSNAFELVLTCRYLDTGPNWELCIHSISPSRTGLEVLAFTSNCTLQRTHIAQFALTRYTIQTLIAGTCGAAAHESVTCRRNKPLQWMMNVWLNQWGEGVRPNKVLSKYLIRIWY